MTLTRYKSLSKKQSTPSWFTSPYQCSSLFSLFIIKSPLTKRTETIFHGITRVKQPINFLSPIWKVTHNFSTPSKVYMASCWLGKLKFQTQVGFTFVTTTCCLGLRFNWSKTAISPATNLFKQKGWTRQSTKRKIAAPTWNRHSLTRPLWATSILKSWAYRRCRRQHMNSQTADFLKRLKSTTKQPRSTFGTRQFKIFKLRAGLRTTQRRLP